MAIRPGNPSTASSPPKSELSDVGVARTRVRITRMGVPFAEIPHLVHRLPGDVVDGLGQADNAAFEPCRTAETVLRLGKCMGEVESLAAEIGDADDGSAGLIGQTLVA